MDAVDIILSELVTDDEVRLILILLDLDILAII